MDFLTKVTNTTREMFLPKVIDGVLDENPLFMALAKNASKWSGEEMKSAIKVQKGKNSTGYGINDVVPLDSNPDLTRLHMKFEPTFRSKAISIPLGRLMVNDSSMQEDKFLNLASVEVESSLQDFADEIGEMLYGVGSGSDFAGLELIVDDGTNSLTYGGLTRSSFPVALSSTVVDAGGALTLAAMRTTLNGAERNTIKPSAAYSNKEIFGFYEALLQPQERLMKTTTEMRLSNGTGYETLHYAGIPMIKDEHATDETLYFIREKEIAFYTVDMSSNPEFSSAAAVASQIQDSNYAEGSAPVFSATSWELPKNSTGFIMQVAIGGEVYTRAPRDHSKLVNITTV